MCPHVPGGGRRRGTLIESLEVDRPREECYPNTMKLRSALTLVLISSLVLLGSLAYSIPVDPGWVPGVYDDGDFDFVVDLITSESGVVQALGATGVRPAAELVVTTVVASDQDPALDPPCAGDAIRAPPAA